jgi:hypothetical protein
MAGLRVAVSVALIPFPNNMKTTKTPKPLSPRRAMLQELNTLAAAKRKVMSDFKTAEVQRKRDGKASKTAVDRALKSIASRRARIEARLATL